MPILFSHESEAIDLVIAVLRILVSASVLGMVGWGGGGVPILTVV